MILSPRGRGRATGVEKETLDVLECVGEGARIWRKDFKLKEFAESGVVRSTGSRDDLVYKVGSPKGELGEDLEVVFDHEKREFFLLDGGEGDGEGKDSSETTKASFGKECVEGLLAESPYAANIADLDGGGRRRRKSSESALGTDALVLRRELSVDRGRVSKMGELTFGELAIDKSDLGKGFVLRVNGRRSFLPVGVFIAAMEG